MLTIGNQAGTITLQDADGREVTLDQFPDKYLHLVFIRHLACIACQGYLHKLKGYYPEFKAKGCEIIAISMSPPKTLKMYGQRVTWPFPLLSDPDRKAYRHFDLKAGSIWRILKPQSLLYYFSLMLRGWLVRPPYEGDKDILQLGGNFILGPDRKILFAHRCADPADRPGTKRVLAALK